MQRGSRGSRGFATSRKTRKIRQTFRSCLSSLTRSCIQDCVQEVPVGPMAQGTPPSAHAAAFQVASTGFINFSMAFLPSLNIFRHELFIVIVEPQVLHQLRNVSKGDVPMALVPDPTTAASERWSVKNRLTGSRRRGSGINRRRSRTVSKPSLRGRHRVQAHPGGVQGQSLCNQP